jgi:hypothetical protein
MDDELLEELKREGYESYRDFCIKNWDKLKEDDKKLLLVLGIHP